LINNHFSKNYFWGIIYGRKKLKEANNKEYRMKRKLTKKPIKKDAEGRSVINLTVYDDSNFLSPYSSNDEEIISDEVARFLENSSSAFDTNDKIHIVIASDEISKAEQKTFANAISNYYHNNALDIQSKIRNTITFSIILLIVGTIIIALNQLLTQFPFFYELVNIAGWVFIWEAVFEVSVDLSKYQKQKHRYVNLMKAKITYKKIITQDKKKG